MEKNHYKRMFLHIEISNYCVWKYYFSWNVQIAYDMQNDLRWTIITQTNLQWFCNKCTVWLCFMIKLYFHIPLWDICQASFLFLMRCRQGVSGALLGKGEFDWANFCIIKEVKRKRNKNTGVLVSFQLMFFEN